MIDTIFVANPVKKFHMIVEILRLIVRKVQL